MQYDDYSFDETVAEHAARLGISRRATRIRRRVLKHRLCGRIKPAAIREAMGASNCPWYLARMAVEDLTDELAVEVDGAVIHPLPGEEPEDGQLMREIADQAGVTVPDLTKILARGGDKEALAEAGVTIGQAPYGYRKQGHIEVGDGRQVKRSVQDSETAPVVQDIFKLYARRCYTYRQIAESLNEMGVSTPSGPGEWDADKVRRIIRNPYYAGYILYRGAEARKSSDRRNKGTLYSGLHKSIVPWETFVAAQHQRCRRRGGWECPWSIASEIASGVEQCPQ